VLVGLLNGIVSLLDNDNNSEGPDPDDPDPEGRDLYPYGKDPDGDRPDKSHKDDSYPIRMVLSRILLQPKEEIKVKG
jgi:hypothetical protein